MEPVIIWADIPVTDMPRAKRFYGEVTGQPVVAFPGSDDVAVIGDPAASEGPVMFSADLYLGGTPSKDGPTIYLNTQGDIDGMLARVGAAGGTILQEKRFMGDMVGWIAFFLDTEGNRIGLQQPGAATG